MALIRGCFFGPVHLRSTFRIVYKCFSGLSGGVRDSKSRQLPPSRQLGPGALPRRGRLPAVAVLRRLRQGVQGEVRPARQEGEAALLHRHRGHMHHLLLVPEADGERGGEGLFARSEIIENLFAQWVCFRLHTDAEKSAVDRVAV